MTVCGPSVWLSLSTGKTVHPTGMGQWFGQDSRSLGCYLSVGTWTSLPAAVLRTEPVCQDRRVGASHTWNLVLSHSCISVWSLNIRIKWVNASDKPVYFIYHSYQSILQLIKPWYDEVNDYVFPYPRFCNPSCPLLCYGPMCTHYTQVGKSSSLVWTVSVCLRTDRFQRSYLTYCTSERNAFIFMPLSTNSTNPHRTLHLAVLCNSCFSVRN